MKSSFLPKYEQKYFKVLNFYSCFVFILVYVDIGTEASGTATLAFAFDGASTNRKYDIKVAQIPCGTKYS